MADAAGCATLAAPDVFAVLLSLAPLLAYNLQPGQWLRAALAAVFIGMSKTGFNGVSLLSIVLMADVLPARQSTGVILPMLIFADCFAVRAFRQHALWTEIRRLLPAAILGVIAGAFIMQLFAVGRISDGWFKRIIGGIVLSLTILQYARRTRPAWFTRLPAGSTVFAWMMGSFAGVTTMLANAAGPVVSLYLLAAGLPKLEFVGTSAWIFLILNLCKVPLSYRLGLIGTDSLKLNLYLAPGVVAGVFVGRWLLKVVPQGAFEQLLLFFAVVASFKLLWG